MSNMNTAVIQGISAAFAQMKPDPHATEKQLWDQIVQMMLSHKRVQPVSKIGPMSNTEVANEAIEVADTIIAARRKTFSFDTLTEAEQAIADELIKRMEKPTEERPADGEEP